MSNTDIDSLVLLWDAFYLECPWGLPFSPTAILALPKQKKDSFNQNSKPYLCTSCTLTRMWFRGLLKINVSQFSSELHVRALHRLAASLGLAQGLEGWCPLAHSSTHSYWLLCVSAHSQIGHFGQATQMNPRLCCKLIYWWEFLTLSCLNFELCFRVFSCCLCHNVGRY